MYHLNSVSKFRNLHPNGSWFLCFGSILLPQSKVSLLILRTSNINGSLGQTQCSLSEEVFSGEGGEEEQHIIHRAKAQIFATGNCRLLHQLYSPSRPTLLTLLTISTTWVTLAIYTSGHRSQDFLSKTLIDITWFLVSSYQCAGWHFFFCSETLTEILQISYPSLFSDIFEKVVLNSTGSGSYIFTN